MQSCEYSSNPTTFFCDGCNLLKPGPPHPVGDGELQVCDACLPAATDFIQTAPRHSVTVT